MVEGPTDAYGSGNIEGRREAHKEAVAVEEAEGGRDTLAVGDVHGVVDGGTAQVVGDTPLPNALCHRPVARAHELAARHPLVENRAWRVSEHSAHSPVRHLLEVLRRPVQRATRPRRTRKRCHSPVRLRPQLGPRRCVVSQTIRRIVKLSTMVLQSSIVGAQH